jgi:GDP-4-dehydro-6-deoxy-D-mannose reductase
MARRAIVIGAQGFVGRYVTRELVRRGIEPVLVVRRPWRNAQHTVIEMQDWSRQRLRAVLEEEQPDVIFHLAGSAVGSAAQLRHTNVGMAEALVAAVGDTKQCPTIVFAGSAAEYGAGLVDGEPAEESTLCRPLGNYGATKLAQTQLALAFARETNVRIVIARIFNAIGAGMPSHLALGSFAAQLASVPGKRGTLLTGNLNVARDFVDVEQVSSVLCDIAKNTAAHGVVNICSGEAVLLSHLVELLIAASGKSIAIKIDPTRLRTAELNVIIGSPARMRQFCKQAAPANFDSLMEKIWLEAQFCARRAG